MKLKIAVIAFTFCSLVVYSQDKKQEILDRVAKETCEYLGSEEVKGLKGDALAMKMGVKIFALYGKYKKEFNEAGITFDMNNPAESGEKLGEQIGMNMIKFCPDTLIALANDDAFTEDETVQKIDNPVDESRSFEGNFKSISGKEILTLSIIDTSGKTQKFVWISNFKGSDRLMDTAKATNTKVKVYFENIEMYSPELQDYVVRKQITQIDYL